MSRHRSPSGRLAHHGPPLLALGAAAGGVGAHRPPALSGTLAVRVVATVVAGGTVAGIGQALYNGALPTADGTNVLRVGVEQLTGTAAAAAPTGDAPVDGAALALLAAPVAAAPVVAAPVATVPVVDPIVAESALIKAADLQQRSAAAAAAQVEAAAAKAPKLIGGGAGGAVQIVVGRVSSGFGMRGGVLHAGLDIAAPIGTPIRVPLAGTVISSGPASGFGLWVRVRHADGTITIYGHINRSLVSVGQKVTAGQQIAEVGNRGQSTGPHLHIEVVTPGGQKINPRPWLDSHGFRYS